MKLKALTCLAILGLAAIPFAHAQRPASSGSVATGTAKNGPSKSSTATASDATPTAASSAVQSSGGRKSVIVHFAKVALIHDVPVPAQEAGSLMKILVKQGQFVEKGTVLAEIDNRETLAKQRIAQGEIDVATVQADSTAEIEVAEKAIDVAKADLDSNVEINKRNPGAVSETELRKYKFQHERALAQRKVALDDKAVAKLTVGLKQAQYDATENQLERLKIIAPFDGEVNDIIRQEAEWLQPGDPVIHLVGLGKLRVNGWVSANDASPNELRGKPVRVTITTAGRIEESANGIVDFASEVIEGFGSAAQYRISVDIDNKRVTDPVSKRESWAIQPGSSAKMEIDLSPQIAASRPAIEVTPAVAPAGGPALTPAGSFVPRNPAAGTPKVETRKPVADEAAPKVRER